MNTVAFEINCPANYFELIIYELSKAGNVNFQEDTRLLTAYIPSDKKLQSKIIKILSKFSCITDFSYKINIIREENWNKIYENNFDPVVLGGKYKIIAPFHQVDRADHIPIFLLPGMAFGTGHHPTTKLMSDMLLKEDLRNKSVCDFGCGTGLLSILAEKEGSSSITAIDNDPHALKNAKFNIEANNCENIRIIQGTLHKIKNEKFDILLANITKNTILRYSELMKNLLNQDGKIICSGFFEEDIIEIENYFLKLNLILVKKAILNNWCAGIFTN